MDKFQNKYRIPSARLQHWDYGSNAVYFITICTKNRAHHFGEIVADEMVLNTVGSLTVNYWQNIPDHFPFVQLGNSIVMPNHIHGIIEIRNPKENDSTKSSPISGLNRFQNQGKNTISSIIGSYKSVVTKEARLIDPDFQWQPRFHDHIIRDSESLEKIQSYIAHNPENWKEDKFYDAS